MHKFNFVFVFTIIQLLFCAESQVIEINRTESMKFLACRTERQMNIPYEFYKKDTCARCYWYMPLWAFRMKFRYNPRLGALQDPQTGDVYDADFSNNSLPVYDTFASDAFADKWEMCCKAALDCCEEMLIEEPLPPDQGNHFCPRTWDGWRCWPDTPAGTIAKEPCMAHIYFKSDPPACTSNQN